MRLRNVLICSSMMALLAVGCGSEPAPSTAPIADPGSAPPPASKKVGKAKPPAPLGPEGLVP